MITTDLPVILNLKDHAVEDMFQTTFLKPPDVVSAKIAHMLGDAAKADELSK